MTGPRTHPAPDDLFSDRLAAWREYTATPWARIRYDVVGETLRRQCAAVRGARGDVLRVLDVGGGDGRDALPLALAGHDVTVVDPSAVWLDEAHGRAAAAGTRLTTVEGGLDDLPHGEWDLVLCHFVLRYRPAGADDVAALAARVRPGGRLSVVDVNPAGRVLRALVTGGPDAAAAELRAERAAVATFGTDARKVDADDVVAAAGAHGLREVARHGIRVANDLLTDDAAKSDPAYFDALRALELDLCDREPYRRVGFAWQVVLER
ncbi:class I SAM-dependent methyltransferase [Luteimicrobium subarcticum]|uniref:S-adenosylmethionine-dependent methyltransferase n=1 Tax=Luteimicrobium subarcticum TaxID=620910 RepID=A0A2M8WSJ1_9MICO|nr:class I SAM-dependent methyltransferase [Luteimicrobium subarcticum]PJI93912.1 S-adenosylmethionine-dependent methyltransferase [Luteimicrobium subarcticum]